MNSKARYFITPAALFTRFEKEGPRVYFRSTAPEAGAEKKIFGDGYGPEKIINSRLSEDGRYLSITVSFGSAADKTEIYVQNLAAAGPITPLINDVMARFSVAIGGDIAFLETNWQASNGRILAVDLKQPARQNWKEIVPAGKFALTGFSLVDGMLALNYLENVTRLKLFDAKENMFATQCPGSERPRA